MSPHLLRAALCAGPIAFLAVTTAGAHEIVGNRMFPATLAIDDPGVADELSLPTVAISKTGDVPSVKQLDISGEYSKRITEDFAVSFSPTWTHLYAPGGPNMTGASGFQNIETTFKYRVFKNAEHEFVVSVGLNIEWGGSGAQDVGAERFTTYTPTFYFGKGFGDLPASMGWARPFAITGQVGYAIPSSNATVTVNPDSGDVDTEFNPRVLIWGASLQYSLPYLKSAVVDLGLPDFVNRLIPLVEASLQTPVSNVSTSGTVTTGTINPGVIWVGDKFQVGVEAMIPVNRQSGSNVGAIAQLHFFLDDIFPNSIGRPIFGNKLMKNSDIQDRHRPRRHPASRRSACARLPRPRQPEGRQHGRRRAARIAAVVHRKTGAGLFHRRGAQCARRGGERQGASRPAATAPNCACRSRRCRPGLIR